MEGDCQADGAINLSTSHQRPASRNSSGNHSHVEEELHSHCHNGHPSSPECYGSKSNGSRSPETNRASPVDTQTIRITANVPSTVRPEPPVAPGFGYHPQMQLGDVGRKQLEVVIQQLQEQLQMNLLQQTFLIQTGSGNAGDKKQSGPMQALALQQQHLMQHLQLAQRHYLMSLQTNFPREQGNPGEVKVEQGVWSAMTTTRKVSSGDNTSSPEPTPEKIKEEKLGFSNQRTTSQEGKEKKTSESENEKNHPLYGHGLCRWPGCETACDDLQSFLVHLNCEHVLDDRSAAQVRVQMQVVSQLEVQQQLEKERLQAMMSHLHLNAKGEAEYPSSASVKREAPPQPPTDPPSSLLPPFMTSGIPSSLSALARTASLPPIRPPHMMAPPTPNLAAPVRRRVSDKSNNSLSSEINRNREFYRSADVRPPFTYASLIRQAIVESPEKQLTLNEIYNWFQNTFCYFRRNAATWKNAIRTNLSLHKCFVRYEDDFGSYWMVDDAEFIRRRHLSRGRPRKFENQTTQDPMTSSDLLASQRPLMQAFGAAFRNFGAQALSQGSIPIKGEGNTTGCSSYGDSLTASLKSALADRNLNFLHRSANLNSFGFLGMSGTIPNPLGGSDSEPPTKLPSLGDGDRPLSPSRSFDSHKDEDFEDDKPERDSFDAPEYRDFEEGAFPRDAKQDTKSDFGFYTPLDAKKDGDSRYDFYRGYDSDAKVFNGNFSAIPNRDFSGLGHIKVEFGRERDFFPTPNKSSVVVAHTETH